MQETWVQSPGQEDSLEKEMAIHSSILAWRIPWTQEPGRLPSMVSQVRHSSWQVVTKPPPPEFFSQSLLPNCLGFYNIMNNYFNFCLSKVLKVKICWWVNLYIWIGKQAYWQDMQLWFYLPLLLNRSINLIIFTESVKRTETEQIFVAYHMCCCCCCC